MKKVLLNFLLFIPISIMANPAIDISGTYRCQGNDFLNKTTFDEPTTVIKTGDTFLFTWKNKNVTFYGTSILQDRTLATVFWTPSNMSAPGVVTYQILPNGDLKGKWTVKESRIVGDEYCQKLK